MPATLNNTGVLFNDSSQQSTAYLGHRVFFTASSTTFTPPAGVTQLKITAVGGGGGGGGWPGATSGRYGGSGGGVVAIITVTGGTTYTVTVGAGGAGKNWNMGQQDGSGSNGGETWFGVDSGSKLVSCGGGTGYTINNLGPCGSTIDIPGVTGSVTVTGTIIRQQNGSTWGGTSGEIISSILFGGQTYNTSGDQAAKTWSTNNAFAAGCGGRGETGNGTGNASGGYSGLILIEY